MRSKVFLIAGGSGGHLFPAISLSESNKIFDYYFLIDDRIEKIIKKKKLKYFKIFSSSLKFSPLLPINLAKIILGFLQSLLIFIKHKPLLVVGFGGYTSIPSILAAKILKIKIIIHEQNAVMGKTNRFLSYLTKNIALTFKNTKYAKNCSVHTGIPVRKKKKKLQSKSKLKRIFVVGGSQGAKIFSKLIPKIIKNFSSSSKKHLIVVQQVRKEDIELTINSYKEMQIKSIIKNFFDDIYYQLDRADLIISRCGSSTLAEIELYNKFSVLFPLPSATDNHQHSNAVEFKKNNQCLICDENKFNFKKISKEIEKIVFKKKLHKIESSRKKLNHKLSLLNFIRKIIVENT
tara:strand:+ start:458 stop:1498 length:1041 start_codon:yes stop_codon:yes gene_type:complete